ncbi:MAG: hypothetical protein JWR21_3695 [Herminiimonas sp.]|nr:hypothetical protein [Herminiimonas sp.]
MKLGFFILAHKDPAHLLRLVDRLDGPDSSFFIHLDARAGRQVSAALAVHAASRPNLFLTPRHRCYWGGSGIVKGTIACIESALASDRDFDYGILLSGQDYPLCCLDAIQDYFQRHRGREFIESFPLDQPNRWTVMPGPYQALNRVQWTTFFIRSRRLHLPVRRQMPRGFVPHGGSQWWALTRPCVEYIAALCQEQPDILDFYSRSFIADESFFQTIIASSPFAPRVCSDDLHYIDWIRPNPYAPRTLECSDLDAMLDSGKLFGRKFDDGHDGAVLDRLDELSQIDVAGWESA